MKDQSLTDLTKAIRYCDQHHAKSIDIVCAIGTDRMDQTLGNIRTLRSEYKPNRLIRLHTDAQTLTFVAHNQSLIHGEIGDYCGIVSFPSASFSSQGLEYNGKDFSLNFGFSESTCNRLKMPIAEVDIKGEALIIHPGQLKKQRALSKKSYLEKFQMVLENSKEVVLLETSVGEWKKIETISQQVQATEINSSSSECPIFPPTHYLSSSEKELRDCKDDNLAFITRSSPLKDISILHFSKMLI